MRARVGIFDIVVGLCSFLVSALFEIANPDGVYDIIIALV